MNTKMAAMGADFAQSLSAAAQDVLLDLWELDLRAFDGGRWFFCNQKNETGGAVVWQGQVYEPWPVQAEGFESNAQGAGNRPRLTVSNIGGRVTAAVQQYRQLAGAAVTRHQVSARFLDAANFAGGNPSADPAQEVISRYLVERMVSLTAETAMFELAVPAETDGALIPARFMLADVCNWQYRSPECGYTGRAVADRLDRPTNDPAKDRCSGSLTGCRARFGRTAVLPFGGFPSADKVAT